MVFRATITLPSGGSLVAGFLGTKGEKHDAEFIFNFYKNQIEDYGKDECIGVVFDGEATYQAAGRKLESEYNLCSLVCQAHALSLLLKDFINLDPLLKWVVDGAHSILVFVNNNKDVRATLKEAQNLFYDKIRATPVGVETRFATAVLEIHALMKNMDAIRALKDAAVIADKYDSPASTETSRRIFSFLKNDNFWKAAAEYEELLMPIADSIHHIEKDMPIVSQLPRIWSAISTSLREWVLKYRPGGVFRIDSVFTLPVEAHSENIYAVFSAAIDKRRKKSWHPCFSLAMVLDARFMVQVGGSFKPDMSKISEDEDEAIVSVLRRLAGDDADEAEQEYLLWIAEGTTESTVKSIVEKAATINGWKLMAGAKFVTIVWTSRLYRKYPKLASLAPRLLAMHATSCSCERLWSLMRWIYRPNRTALGLEKATKVATVTAAEWLHRRILRGDNDAMDSLVESLFETYDIADENADN